MEKICVGKYQLFFEEVEYMFGNPKQVFGLSVAGESTMKIYSIKEPVYKSQKQGFVCTANKRYITCTNGFKGLKDFARHASTSKSHLNRMTLDHLMDWVNYNTHIVRVEKCE